MKRALIGFCMALLVTTLCAGELSAQGKQNPILEAEGHIDGIDDLTFSKNGRKIYTACVDGSIGIWNAKTLANIKSIRPSDVGDGGFVVIDVSPDGSTIAAGNGDWMKPKVFIVSEETGIVTRVLQNHSSLIAAIRFSPDGKYLATGALDGWCNIYDTSSWKLLVQLKQGCGTVDAIAFHPKEPGVLAIGAYENSIVEIWEIEGPKLRNSWKAQEGGVVALEWLDRGKKLVSAGYDGYIRVWDPLTKEKLLEMTNSGTVAGPVAFSAKKRLVIVGLEDQTIEVFDLKTGLRKPSLGSVAYPAWALDFDPKGRRIAGGGSKGKLQLWKKP